MEKIRFEKIQHICSIPMCDNITDCYMITRMHGYINAVYLCPTCAREFVTAFKDELLPKAEAEETPVEVKPKKTTKKAAK